MFAALDAEAAAALRSSMDAVHLSKGQALFNEGERGDRLYIITDGKMKLGHTSSDGRESLLAVLGPGDAITVGAAALQEGRSPSVDLLILGGRPIREPVAWLGPFVMNTREEVLQAMADYQAGRLGTIPAVHGAPSTMTETRQA